ncbi:GGDEF domain-containing protein [Aquabacter sp. P-9]|uniref:GGDEF domain-containing protein n=1 Tax=Aquabacter sediminis TaxID=3029197 RepID=UPI00237E93D8|nr:GGDEF domain-containing protein [Aquabacter sp. P-9]MDE1569805.1 GGDEF domain-containing protein [Aquabacter sp. P-9]
MAITPEAPAAGERLPPSAQEGLSWLNLVHHPLLAIGADGRHVLAANKAARALLHIPDQPVALPRLAGLVGDWAAVRLSAHVQTRAPGDRLLLPLERPAATGVLAVRHARLPAPADGYLLTLEPGASFLEGEARGWTQLSQDVLAGLPLGLKIFDLDFNQVFSNAVSDDMFAPPAAGGRLHLEDWWTQAFPEEDARQRAMAEWRHRLSLMRLQSNQFAQSDWDVRCRDGATRTIQFRFGFIGELYVMAYWDITARRRMEEELRRLAGTDALTGLGNRRMFMERSEAAFHHALLAGTPLSVLIFDMDRFKWINDRYGHPAGDAVLREVAARCRAELRPHDVFARLGGEEFAILISGADLDVAERVAHRLARAIASAPVETPAASLDVRASFGVAGLTREDANLEAVIERADRALYLAKARGRNRVVVSDGTEPG